MKKTNMCVPLTEEQLDLINEASLIVMRPKSHFVKYFALEEAKKILDKKNVQENDK
jgi:uncharacterized protein (DUF1778 family)